MPSKREQILAKFAQVLAATAGVAGRVYRSSPEPSTLDETPCLEIRWSAENASPETVPQLERTLTVHVSVLARGDVPDTEADAVIVSAHALIMADPSLGGLAIDTRLDSAGFEFVSADQTGGRLTHDYAVKFRHSYADMTI